MKLVADDPTLPGLVRSLAEDVRARLDALAEAEARIVAALPLVPRIH